MYLVVVGRQVVESIGAWMDGGPAGQVQVRGVMLEVTRWSRRTGGRAMRVRELLLASALLLSAGGDAEWTTWGRHVRQDRRLLPA